MLFIRSIKAAVLKIKNTFSSLSGGLSELIYVFISLISFIMLLKRRYTEDNQFRKNNGKTLPFFDSLKPLVNEGREGIF